MADDNLEERGRYFIGVDVGTASVRAGLFTDYGKLVAHDKHDIKTWVEESVQEGCFEQSTDDIWKAVCTIIKSVIKGVNPSCVLGIGFDATCSLVAVGPNGEPITVSLSGDPQRNVILWKDHRAITEANEINKLGHPVLKFVGGSISPEMEPPKLLWLKKNLFEECWTKAGHFFDLADYLVYRSTGETVRSLCTLVCKWTYIGHTPSGDSDVSRGWNESFWQEVGLADFVEEGYSRIGTVVKSPGEAVGTGLLAVPASELGLLESTPVAVSLIDAHAGGVGMVGADLSSSSPFLSSVPSLKSAPLSSRLAIVSGTSACHMATSPQPLFVPGVWGPYYSAMVPGFFLNEGGQSAAGSLLDHILKLNDGVFDQLQQLAKTRGHSIYIELDHTLSAIARERSLPDVALLTKEVHVVPDFHGNRSPLADPLMRGMISGLSLNNSLEETAVLYLAAMQSLAYSTRHIIEVMTDCGHLLEAVFVCGGLAHNSLYIDALADVTGIPVVRAEEEAESVLLGSAILAKAAATNEKVQEVMSKMTPVSVHSIVTSNLTLKEFHSKKYTVFRSMLLDQIKYRNLMT